MYWGVPLVVRLVGEGKKWDWVNYNVVTGRGLSQCLESSEAWMALQSCLELGQVAGSLYSCITPTWTGHWMGDIPLVRHDTPSTAEVSVSVLDMQVPAAPQHHYKEEQAS